MKHFLSSLPLSTMHAQAALGDVQHDAPLHARQRITIHAPREHVWAVLTDFAGWPAWMPGVAKVDAPAAVAPGARFTWVTDAGTIRSQLALVEPGARLAWTGKVSLAKAIHVWRLSSPTPDTTEVEVEETLDGLLLTWFYKQHQLDASIAHSLDQLRARSELRTQP